MDVLRTRAGDPDFQDPAMTERLERLLLDFCRQEGIGYTQGLHEVAAVFAFLEAVGGLPPPAALALFTAFVHRFVPFYHDDESFVSLHVSLLFFRQLILYHHPDLHNQLEEAGVSPLVYATPWFFTIFAARTPMTVVLRLWDQYITRGEDHFLPCLAVAMLVGMKSAILLSEQDDAHSAIGRASISDEAQMQEIWGAAADLKAKTPRSFGIRFSRVLEAVKEKGAAAQHAAEAEQPWSERVLGRVEKEKHFVVLPGEVAAHCVRAQRQVEGAGAEAPPAGKSGRAKLRFMLLDLRPDEEQQASGLQHALHFNPPCLRRFVAAARKGTRPRLESLAAALALAATGQSGRLGEEATKAKAPLKNEHDALIPEVFAALQEAASDRWGEDWLSESAHAHLVLLGGQTDLEAATGGSTGGAVAPLYEALTESLCIARVSVAQGGAAAIEREASKHGYEIMDHGKERAQDETLGGILGSAWSRLQAASGKMPAAEKVGGRFGDALSQAAQGLKEGFREGAAAVRQQAVEGATAVKQQAAGSMSAIGNLIDRLDRDLTTVEDSAGASKEAQEAADQAAAPPGEAWMCEAWVAGQAEPEAGSEREILTRAVLKLTQSGRLVLLEPAEGEADEMLNPTSSPKADRPTRCCYRMEELRKVGTSQSAPRVVGFYFPAADETAAAVRRPALLVRFETPEEATACAKTVAARAAAAKRRQKALSRAQDAEAAASGEKGCPGADAAGAAEGRSP